ncbi:hypothetical protein [Methylobacterium sp. 1030]
MSHNGSNGFIELNRSFHELSKWASEDDNHDLSNAFIVGPAIKWPAILLDYRTIILSEAGSGKTAEIRNQARMLEAQGKPAFFLRLENVGQDFDIAFEVGSPETFEAWLESIEEGWVFLDSVDEARLKSPIDFQTAIKRVGRRLVKALDRTHIVITGRTSAWRARSDYALCVESLPISRSKLVRETSPGTTSSEGVSETKQETPAIFKIITLDSLQRDQIETFARRSGILDTKQFLTAIDRADASTSTLRPQDLVEVVAFWKANDRIGTRYELMQFSIERRLTEHDQNRRELKPLTTKVARRAAKLVAAAATLSKTQAILLPDHEPGLPGINLDSLLPEWPALEQTTLLSRPIFDEAIYGSVRFYHRTVREYLTAEWLSDLLKKQTSRKSIYQLLFRNQYGLDVIPPTMRPIMSWLVILDEDVRNRVLKIAPEVTLEGGDPTRLPVEVRRSLLNDVCARVAAGTSGRTIYDYGAVQRFASDDIADEVSKLLVKYRKNQDITWFLLRMVWIGQLASCLSQAKTIAFDPKSAIYPRIAAFKAVEAIGSAQDRLELRVKFLNEKGERSRQLLGELLSGSPYSKETIDWLVRCIGRSEDRRRHSSDQLQHEMVDWVAAAPSDILLDFIKALAPFLTQKPVKERRFCEISVRFGWLMKPLCKAVERLIAHRSPHALEHDALAILVKIPAAKTYDIDISFRQEADFKPLVRAWPELNRALFWYAVQIAREAAEQENPRNRVTSPWQASLLDDLWGFEAVDFDYFIEQINLRNELDDKLIALTIAIRLFANENSPDRWKQQLQAASMSNHELAERLRGHFYPLPPSAEELKWKKQEKIWKIQAEKRQSQQEANRAEWRKRLQEMPDKIRDHGLPNPEDISRPQWYLLEVLRDKSQNLSRWSDARWELLAEEFGDAVAEAFRDGAVAYWRKHDPKVRSEGAPANSTTHRVVFGLTGLEIEAGSDPKWVDNLNSLEATRACRYASHEMNGFPLWLPKLFEKFPHEVVQFLIREIAFELRTGKPNQDSNYILSDVAWSGEWLWDAIAPHLLAIVKVSEPNNTSALEKVLKILQGATSIADQQLRDLARGKATSLRRDEHAAMWFSAWVGVDPEGAIPSLQKKLGNIKTESRSVTFAMIFAQNLVGGRTRQSPRTRANFQKPDFLKRIYLLMHEYIRRAEDIDRSNTGGYSPGLRDDAQEARDGIFSLLNAIPGKEAYVAIEEIARLHPDEGSRAFMLQYALSKAQTDADLVPWSPEEVVAFNDHLERTPSDHRSLAELVMLRLLDMKEELEEGDTSLAKILLSPSLGETDVRLYFGREFRDKASGRYIAPQEEELADAKRPDIRIHGMGFDAPVPVELKLADKWSGAELFERFRNQLGGDYLRDGRSSRGVFLLVWRGEQKSWRIPGRRKAVSFGELVESLQSYWSVLSPEYPGVDELTVVGIDLTKRLQASNEPVHPKLTG